MESLSTQRLILRRWQPCDVQPFALINSDPRVMEFFPKTLSLEETRASVEKMEKSFDADGFGLWALELRETSRFIGYVGLNRPSFHSHFTPCVEIGWKIAYDHWNKGLATEAAYEVVKDGFTRLLLTEIVAMTAAINTRSIRVMEKLNMTRDPSDDFSHPLIEDGHRLKEHVLFKLGKCLWLSTGSRVDQQINRNV